LLTDPQSITINATPVSLVRTGASIDSGVFRAVDNSYTLSINHVYGKRTRRTTRLDYKVLAPDVMDSSLNVPYTASVYTVVDIPNVGVSNAQVFYMWDGLNDLLAASSNAKQLQIIAGES
jgi:hypothetical protein